MVQEEKTVVTKEGYQELVNELDHYVHVVRQDVIRELQEARAQGDLSENADYDAARERQARVEARIRDLEAMIKNAQIIDDKEARRTKRTVKLGSTVRILDMESNEEETYTIVGSVEADPLNGKLSNLTPLAMALLDSKVGDTRTVNQVEEPYKVKILEVK
ncbi:MAG: transcription elongation factor GreA [Traorella sp.]